MEPAKNPLAPEHLPSFLPGPDGSDPLFVAMVVFVLVGVLLIGNLYLRLHSFPERFAHRMNNVQLQAVTVLTLLALFTHNHIFWVVALLIAIVRFPDLTTPLNDIAKAARQFSAGGTGAAATPAPGPDDAAVHEPPFPDAAAQAPPFPDAAAQAPPFPDAAAQAPPATPR